MSEDRCVVCDDIVPEGSQVCPSCRDDSKSRKIKDSGNRREFESGAVRDIQEGKGRCDLLPLSVCSYLMNGRDDGYRSAVLNAINSFKEDGAVSHIYIAIKYFMKIRGWSAPTALLEVSKHFEEGSQKYGEYNWQKGIPVHCYIDSGVRHFIKYCDGYEDEPHDRAFVWNMLCCIWTYQHMPELDDYTKKSTT